MVTPNELKKILTLALQSNHYMPVLITGQPGIGKSDIVTEVCHTLGHELIIEHPAISDPTDSKGVPAYLGNKEADFLPTGTLKRLINATAPTVCFLDDLGQAPASVQAAYMQWILARKIGQHAISPLVKFIAATNRKGDKSGVTSILEAVKSRFATIVELDFDLDCWLDWAKATNFPPELLAFARFRPSMICDFRPNTDMANSPSPRTVANIAKWIAAGIPAELEYSVFSGACGEAFAVEFIGFKNIKLPPFSQILSHPLTTEIPTSPSTLYALTGNLSSKTNRDNIDAILTYIRRMPVEYGVIFVNDLSAALHETSAFINWTVKNKGIIL